MSSSGLLEHSAIFLSHLTDCKMQRFPSNADQAVTAALGKAGKNRPGTPGISVQSKKKNKEGKKTGGQDRPMGGMPGNNPPTTPEPSACAASEGRACVSLVSKMEGLSVEDPGQVAAAGNKTASLRLAGMEPVLEALRELIGELQAYGCIAVPCLMPPLFRSSLVDSAYAAFHTQAGLPYTRSWLPKLEFVGLGGSSSTGRQARERRRASWPWRRSAGQSFTTSLPPRCLGRFRGR